MIMAATGIVKGMMILNLEDRSTAIAGGGGLRFGGCRNNNSGRHINSRISVISLVKASQNTSSNHSHDALKKARQRRPQNVNGDFFVDHTCIDCDTCRWMAPTTFSRVDELSAVVKQPSSKEERVKALQALLSCPTSSIHTENAPRDILEVHNTFPIPISEQRFPGVYHCGYHSEKSFGGASYIIVHPEGNILIDSPRYTERIARKIEMLGGARYMFLTHKDDVADHEKWSKRLECPRILHLKDVDIRTTDVEMKLEGSGPWSLGNDFELIYTPGHTEGCVCLLYKPLKILFAGDHLAVWESELTIMEKYNWWSVPMQLNSVRKLLDVDFELILPGHGRRAEFKDAKEKTLALEALLVAREQTSNPVHCISLNV
ncbi:uncharacterized protein LOC122064094 [Macadamia integrifolia]|uniref:uncharacterized protein LOC122064094 n=1 Tax=Macadamia integrifolia TaxID=60698 RepID=UPI001C4F5121|nr:uncharacterized protein LOC122064094 [Macadamia integrifolia]